LKENHCLTTYQIQQKIDKVKADKARLNEAGRVALLNNENKVRNSFDEEITPYNLGAAAWNSSFGAAYALGLEGIKGITGSDGGADWNRIKPSYLGVAGDPNFKGQSISLSNAINDKWAKDNPGLAGLVDIIGPAGVGYKARKAYNLVDKTLDFNSAKGGLGAMPGTFIRSNKIGTKSIYNPYFATNIADLKYAKDWSNKYGYEFPENLNKIAKSKEKTDNVIKDIIDTHNTFIRGVSTNWENVNPKVLAILDDVGIDYKNNPKAAAEYMATHVPGKTGYGRASLNKNLMDEKELDAIYTSNSATTAEGYTYGDGYKVKVKRPTDFSSPSRKDWFEKNKLEYFKKQKLTPEEKNLLSDAYEDLIDSPEYLKKSKDLYFNKYKVLEDEAEAAGDWLKKQQYQTARTKELSEWMDAESEIRSGVHHKLHPPELKSGQVIKTDHKPNTVENLMKKKEAAIKHRIHQEVGREYYDVLKPLREEYKTNKKNKELKKKIASIVKEANEKKEKIWQTEGIKELAEREKYFKETIEDRNKYAHYLFMGKPGEKLFDAVELSEITPDIFKNKSRAHKGKYSKGLSAGISAGAIGTGATQETKQQGGSTDNKQFEIYQNYINGVFDEVSEEEAEKVYDKLNRMYYAEAKQQGMSPANFIMTHVIGSK